MAQTHATHGSDQSSSGRKLFSLALGGLFIGLFVTWAVIRLASGNIQIDPPKYHGVVINSTEPLLYSRIFDLYHFILKFSLTLHFLLVPH